MGDKKSEYTKWERMTREQVNQYLCEKYFTAKNLFDACNQENNGVDPVNWLHNQDEMRKLWEDFIHKTKQSPLLSAVMLSGPFADYNNFMYDTYPPGFGKAMNIDRKKRVNSDVCEIFKLYKLNTLKSTNQNA